VPEFPGAGSSPPLPNPLLPFCFSSQSQVQQQLTPPGAMRCSSFSISRFSFILFSLLTFFCLLLITRMSVSKKHNAQFPSVAASAAILPKGCHYEPYSGFVKRKMLLSFIIPIPSITEPYTHSQSPPVPPWVSMTHRLTIIIDYLLTESLTSRVPRSGRVKLVPLPVIPALSLGEIVPKKMPREAGLMSSSNFVNWWREAPFRTGPSLHHCVKPRSFRANTLASGVVQCWDAVQLTVTVFLARVSGDAIVATVAEAVVAMLFLAAFIF